MNAPDWIQVDRKVHIALSGVFAVAAVFQTSLRGDGLSLGWPPSLLLLGILAGAYSVGLVLRQEWSRWMGTILGGLFISSALSEICWRGLSFLDVTQLVLTPFLLWQVWTIRITRVQEILNDPDFERKVQQRMEELECQQQWNIVLLFRRPITLDAVGLARIAGRAFGVSFQVVDRYIDPVDAAFLPSEYSDPVVVGTPPVLICYCPPHLLGVYVVAEQHPELCDDDDLGTYDAADRQTIEEHRACVELEVLPYVGGSDPVDDGYAVSGRLAAEMVVRGCVGVLFAERKRFLTASAELRDALRSPSPAAALDL